MEDFNDEFPAKETISADVVASPVFEIIVGNGPADPFGPQTGPRSLQLITLVSPKGWAGARLGMGMVLVVGIPLIEDEHKIQMFKFLKLKITTE